MRYEVAVQTPLAFHTQRPRGLDFPPTEDVVIEYEGRRFVWHATHRGPEGQDCWPTIVHFDLVYTPVGVEVLGHPGARSMGSALVGRVELENTGQVFVTSVVRPMQDETRRHVEKLGSARILDADGNPIDKLGMLAFGAEPNPDADDGTFVGTFLDVTRPEAQ